MLIYLFVLGAWMVYVTRDGMGGGDLSSTQTDELFWSKVIQSRGVFHILSKISEIYQIIVVRKTALHSRVGPGGHSCLGQSVVNIDRVKR